MGRPKIKISSSNLVRIFDILSIASISFIIILSINSYIKAPDIVPTHFDINGNPNNWGNKITLFIIPGISVLLYIILTIASHYPHIFNYPVKITEGNAERQYLLAIELLSLLKLSVLILFIFISLKIYCKNIEINTIIPVPVLFAILVLIITIRYFFRARKIK